MKGDSSHKTVVSLLKSKFTVKSKKSALLFPSGRMAKERLEFKEDNVRTRLDYNDAEIIIELDGFTAICPFEFGVGASAAKLNLGGVDITNEVHAPFPIVSTGVAADHECIKRTVATDWISWVPLTALIKSKRGELMVCDHQILAYIENADAEIVVELVESLICRTKAFPFMARILHGPASRLSDQVGFQFDPRKVEPALQELVSLALEWCIGSEDEIEQYARRVGLKRKRLFIETFARFSDELQSFCSAGGDRPISSEVMTFQLAWHAFATLK